MQLPLDGNLSLALSKSANETEGTLAAIVNFFGITANAEASFATQQTAVSNGTARKLGIEEVKVEFEYTDPSSLFHMAIAVDYNSNCTVGEKVLQNSPRLLD